MVKRLIKPLKNHSFFLFGPRGSGKTSWLNAHFSSEEALYINLLDPILYDEFLLDKSRLKQRINSSEGLGKLIIIDEVQRLPWILDVVHDEIVQNQRTFILTGSSSRRLKQQGTNLLAGRAFIYHLYPFSQQELGSDFDLSKALARGLLPEAYLAQEESYAREYLRSYVFTYLEKEIQAEQWVRKLDPFRRFLEVAAQMNGKPLNFLKISREVGVEHSTISQYYEILEDTMLGFHLYGYHSSIRKQLQKKPKFYFIDTGLVRALDRSLSFELQPSSYHYGQLFENFLILEIKKWIEVHRLDWTLSYLRTRDDVEIDLVVSRPRQPMILIEIKSSERASLNDCKALLTLGRDLDAELGQSTVKLLISRDPVRREESGVEFVTFDSLLSVLQAHSKELTR